MPTPWEWFDKGWDLRAWCYACMHTAIVDGDKWYRFKDLDVGELRQRLKCSRCRSKDVLLVPARAAHDPTFDGKRLVVSFFHQMRSKRRR